MVRIASLTLPAVCGCAHKQCYLNIVVVAIVGALIALGSEFGAS
ncbi:hypothetical protein [Methylocystis sp.]|nr:hypothetical protein [Methylocystis sp.]